MLMTLFTLLLVLAWERLFKWADHWQLDHVLIPVFRLGRQTYWLKTILITLLWMLLIGVILYCVRGMFFGALSLLLWVVLGVFCLGAGVTRKHYRAYLKSARQGDVDAGRLMALELTLIHGQKQDGCQEEQLRELQNALLWINFRYYLAPLFWLVVCGAYGPVCLGGYALLRGYQSWLARCSTPVKRAQSGVDALLHVLDWIPVRLAGVAYALLGHGEKALPAWVASLGDLHTSQYRVLTNLAQFSLARESHIDAIETPKAAVSLARKVTIIILVVVALLTIYGTLV
jgi:AmpE protein